MFNNPDLEAKLSKARQICEKEANKVVSFAKTVKAETRKYSKKKLEACKEELDCKCQECINHIG